MECSLVFPYICFIQDKVNLSTVYTLILCAVVSASVSGQGILSGHADGTVVRYFFSSGDSQVTKGNGLLWLHYLKHFALISAYISAYISLLYITSSCTVSPSICHDTYFYCSHSHTHRHTRRGSCWYTRVHPMPWVGVLTASWWAVVTGRL